MRVQACGVCGSDVFLQDGGFAASPLPIVPGHEAAGIVDALGDGVDDVPVGDARRPLLPLDAGGRCLGRAGVPNRSPSVLRMGVDVDGAFAEYVLRPRASLIVPSAPLPAPELAVITDAVATPLHALRRIAKLQAGETVAVVGIGGLGSTAVQLVRAYGATAIAISRSQEKRDLALRLGAAHALPSDDRGRREPARSDGGRGRRRGAAVRRLRGGLRDIAVARGARRAHRLRRVFLGAVPRAAHADDLVGARAARVARLRARRTSRRPSSSGSPAAIDVDHLVQTLRPLEEAQSALDDLRAGRVLRSVLVP